MDELFELLTNIAANPSSGEEAIRVLIAHGKEVVDVFKPVARTAATEFVDMYKEYADNVDRYAEAYATVKKKFYDSFIKAGFNDEQAFSLTMENNTLANILKASLNNIPQNSNK